MKKSKWVRLGLGVCLLAVLFIFQGSSDSKFTKCALCWLEEGAVSGYLEIRNNTPYNISVVIWADDEKYGPIKITANPSFLRKMLGNGTWQVHTYVHSPIDQTKVYYKCYSVKVTDQYKTTILTVTTPLGYIPVPD